ncbi:hypothetical protein ACOTFS_06910, partial [Achromobacter xylosoxidans]
MDDTPWGKRGPPGRKPQWHGVVPTIAAGRSEIHDGPASPLAGFRIMIAMLSFTIPAAGILALRNALGEERAIAVAQALEHARLQGEADLLKRSQDEARAELQAYALSRVDFARERAELERDIAKRAAQEQFDRLVEIVA